MRLAVIGLAALGAVGCPSSSEGESGSDRAALPSASANRGPGWPVAAKFARRLVAMRRAAADSGLTEERCPDAAILEQLGAGAGRLLTAEHEYLSRYAEPGARGRARGRGGRWTFLTSPALRAVRAPIELESRSAATDAAYKIRQIEKAYRFAAVIRTTKRREPEMAGDRFVAGEFEGWVVVFDLESGERRCAARVSARSADEVPALEGTDRDRALWNDFAMRVRRALDDAVGRVTRHLTLDLG